MSMNGIDRLYELTVRQLREKAQQEGIDISHVVEKSEIVDLLRRAKPGIVDLSSGVSPSIAMSVSDLRDIIRSSAGRTSQCTEKLDLFNLAHQLLENKICQICTEKFLQSFSEIVVRMNSCCSSFFHQECLAKWIMTNVTEQGQYPPKCPSCSALLADSFVAKSVITPSSTNGMYLRYIAAVDGIKRLRNQKGGLSSEEESQLISLGFRKCPKCSSFIEKGPSMEAFGIAMVEGCDKMTCRCGCKFCFKCGSIDAKCLCTGQEHGFFSHQEVLESYPRSNITSPSGFINSLF
jgi:hypothetical protein